MMANPHALVEGVVIASLRDPRQPRVHLHPRRGRPRHPAGARGRGRGLRRRLPRQGHPRAAASTSTSTVHAGAGAYICGEETALLDSLEGMRGQPRLDRRSRRSPASTPARPSSTTSSRSPACRPSSGSGADWFTSMGTEKSPGFTLYSLSGHVTRPGSVRGAARHHAARAARPRRRRTRGPRAEVLDPRWLLDADAHGRAPRRTRSTTRASAPPARCSGTKALQIFDETTCVRARGAALDRVLQARVLRQVHAVPRGHLLAGPDPATGSSAARAARTTSAKLLDLCDNILGRAFCALGDGATSPITSSHPVLPRRVHRAPRPHGGCPFDPVASTVFAGAHA